MTSERELEGDADEAGVTPIIEACDELIQRVEAYSDLLRSEQVDAGSYLYDHRYHHRVRRGIAWSEKLLDTIDDVLDLIGALRHNHNQLRWAREGKLV